MFSSIQHRPRCAKRMMMRLVCIGLLAVVAASRANAQFTTLFNFDPSLPMGGNPYQPPVFGIDGNLYGTTTTGGPLMDGAVYKITPDGLTAPFHMFNGEEYTGSESGVIQASDGNIYGTTGSDGANSDGTVFKITPDGFFTVIHDFNGTDGSASQSNLVQGADGALYGTASGGGNAGPGSTGTVFRITTAGVLTTLHTFTGADGSYPTAGLVQGPDGNIYGSTYYGGLGYDGSTPTSGNGTIFKITPGGVFTSLHQLTGAEASNVYSPLTLGADGNFYGCASFGGTGYDVNTPTSGDGAVFKITPDGVFTVVYSFSGGDGSDPVGAPALAADGSFYGATGSGGANGNGTLFNVTPAGVLTTLHAFTGADGQNPTGVTLGRDGNLYGTTYQGGPSDIPSGDDRGGNGTIFAYRVTNGVPAVTSLDPDTAFAGSPTFTLTINGANFVPGSTISWNGAPLASTYVSPAVLTATVPASALTAVGAASVTVTNPAPGGGVSNAVTFSITSRAGDFNGDGNIDLILQNQASNKVALWYMGADGALLGGSYLSVTPAAGWRVVGSADLNGDGKTDLVLQNAVTRRIAFWYLRGATVTGGAYVPVIPSVGWRVAGVRDFNGDGKPDLILQNTVTNKVAFWYMNGLAVTGGEYASVTPPSGWSVVASGDFDGDGMPDLVLQNESTGQTGFWYMDGASVLDQAFAVISPGTAWKITGAADFSGDGKPDLVLQNTNSGQISSWFMDDITQIGALNFSQAPPFGWLAIGPR